MVHVGYAVLRIWNVIRDPNFFRPGSLVTVKFVNIRFEVFANIEFDFFIFLYMGNIDLEAHVSQSP